MKEKIPKLLQLFCLITMLNLLFVSCEKDLYEQPTDTSFTAEDAKEWYYSNLKKAEQFKVSSKNNGNKLPDWKHGVYRKTGDFEIVEFPLMKDKKTVSLPKNNLLTDANQKRILNASLIRVVFIKNGNNKVELRELNYIPDYNYLESKGFDISGVDLSKGKNDFTGTLIIKTWDSQVLSIKILSKGKIVKSSTKNKRKTKNSINAKTSGITCIWYEVVEYEQICEVICYGDNCYPTGTCSEWYPTGNSSPPYEVCTDDGLGCEFSSDPNCECNLYGLGCNNDVPGNGDTNTTNEDKIDDSLLDSCTKAVLDKLKNLSGGDINSMLNHFAPAASINNINMSTGQVQYANNYAETKTGTSTDINMVFNSNYINGVGNPSPPTDLSVATTMAHEIIHAYLISFLNANSAQGAAAFGDFPSIYEAYCEYHYSKNPAITIDAHHELIAKQYVDAIAATIEQFHIGGVYTSYPQQIYIDMAWGGLTKTTYFNNMYPDNPNNINYDDRQRILARIIAEKLGSQYGVTTPLGTPCK